MKTTKIKSLLAITIICASMLSCKKEVISSPPSPRSPAPSMPITTVFSSDWFSADWDYATITGFTKNVFELNDQILKSGRALVFGKGGFEIKDATILPASFDANYIGVKVEIRELKFTLEGGGAISNTLKFKYILIPAEKLAPGNSLDYHNYSAVCAYYHIPE
jgi:hypothetical protein